MKPSIMRWRLLRRSRFLASIAGLLLMVMLIELPGYLFDSDFFSLWRQQAEAATGIIDPNGDVGTNTGTLVTCASGTLRYTCLDDEVRDPSIPDTADDFLQLAGGNQTDSDMTTIAGVATATAVSVKVYHQETSTNMTLAAVLVNAAGTVIAGPTNFTNLGVSNWETIPFTGLSLNQAAVDGLRVRLTCTRSGGPQTNRCNVYAMYAEVTYDPVINVTVSGVGSQQDVVASTTNNHLGGAFRIVGNNGSRNITSITIRESGTIDANAHIKNVRLLYDFDTTFPYDCVSESFAGTELQFGATSTDGFNSANGTATFTGTAAISPTQTMCVYVVADILNAANSGDTIELEIGNPTVDVVGSGSPVITPDTVVSIPGTTIVQKVNLDQVNYHWRADNGSEITASSTTNGTENTPNTDFPKGAPQRLRVAISNEGNATSSAVQYRLEFASKVTTCAAATGWTDIGLIGGSFSMAPTSNLTDGSDTTNIATSSGGVSDPNPTFLTPNGGVRDVNSQTGGITLSPTQFVELEYSIAATSTLVDGASYCFRVTNAGTPLQTYTRYPEITIGADLTLATVGLQAGTLVAGSVDQHVGGAFRLTNTTGDTDTLTSFTITASGTSNLPSDFTNIRIFYDVDASAPYDCSSQSYAITDSTFGSPVASFASNGRATFTGSLNVTSVQTACLYVVLNVATSVANGTTLEISVANPTGDILIGGATIAPNAQVSIPGVTVLARQQLEQTGYHWRNNNGTETGATSATGGIENTPLIDIGKETTYRIRMAVSNEGLATSSATTYRLEWAQKTSTCDAAFTWQGVDVAGDDWEMSPTANLTDGSNTTNISTTSGGVTDPNPSFLSVNGGVKDSNDTTATSTLTPTQFIELEYSIRATVNSTQGATYCFRVTNAGVPLDMYIQYPEAKVKLDTDFKIQRGVTTLTGTTATISAGAEYESPGSNTSAFIRITNTQHTGGGPDTTGNRNANDITVHISNPSNITSSITFTRTSASVPTRVYWEIVEYRGVAGGENEMVVRRAESLSYTAGATTVTGSAVSGVASSSKVVAFITGQHNRDGGRNNYHQGLSTAAYDGGSSQVTLTRSASGVISDVSYALVEFTGSNWKIQRVEHTYSAVAVPQTQSITAVNSLTRTFLHTQKRLAGSNINHADFGHEVWLSGIGQVSFLLDAGAATAANHTSVAWVIENTQTLGARMVVTRQNDTLPTSATANQSNFINIGKTLSDLSITSLFVNNRSDETARTWPEPIIGVDLVSATQFLLWRSDASANVNYRAEIVEWPTAARKLTQSYYRFYVDNNAITPTDPWPLGAVNLGENAEMTADDGPLAPGDTVRIRMAILVTSAAMPETLDSFTLQYAERVVTCSSATAWEPVAPIGSTTAAWRGFNGAPGDGTPLSTNPPGGGDLLLSVSTVAGTYQEENDSALNPYPAFPGDYIEYDWVVQHNVAKDKTSYCFRMVEASGDTFIAYNHYPVVRTVGYEPRLTNWRWYDDETSLTPTIPLAVSENVAPTDVVNQNSIKLRLVLRESSGATGNGTKFALQYSQYSDFSREVFAVVATTSCQADSIWCYAEGAGVDNQIIQDAVISDAGPCSGGVGTGCGTHNTATTTPSTFNHAALTSAEFEFTIKHAGARANGVYYFRLYDVVNDAPVALAESSSHPSLVTEGAQLVFGVTGLPVGTTTAGVVTNATASPASVTFGNMTIDTDYIAAHRISVNTNATEGYRVLTYVLQQLVNTYGEPILPLATTNASPGSWEGTCTAASVSCAGYHTTDATLSNGSTRFAPSDSYAGLHTEPAEIMYSSLPTSESHDVVYRVRVGPLQPAGDYETEMIYLAIPTF